MATVAQIVPLLVFFAIAGLIGARLLRGRVSFTMPKPPPRPKRARRLRIVPKDQMDRDLNDLLRRK